MCLTPERKAEIVKLRPDWKDLEDKALDDALAVDYVATQPAINAVLGRATKAEEQVAELTAAKAAADAEILALSGALADKEAKVLELSAAAAPRVVDPEALRDRAANYRDRLALMVDRAQISNDVAAKIIAAGLTDEKPSVLMLTGAADLGGKRPIELVINLLDGMVPVQTGNAVTRSAGTAAPPQFPALDLSGAGGNGKKGDDPIDEAREYEARQLTARGLAPAGK